MNNNRNCEQNLNIVAPQKNYICIFFFHVPASIDCISSRQKSFQILFTELFQVFKDSFLSLWKQKHIKIYKLKLSVLLFLFY